MCCHRQSGHLHLEQNQCLVTCVQDKISFLLPTFGTNRVVACILDTYNWNKINVLLPAFRTPTSGTKSTSCYLHSGHLHLEQNQRLVTAFRTATSGTKSSSCYLHSETYILNKINVLLPAFRTPTSGTKSTSCYMYSGHLHLEKKKNQSCYLYSGQDQFAVTYIWTKRELTVPN